VVIRQQALFEDTPFWAARYRLWFTSGKPYASLDTLIGNPSPIFQE